MNVCDVFKILNHVEKEIRVMTTYSVQYTLPVDIPCTAVRMKVSKGTKMFLVPINHPDAHNMGYQDLIAAVELGKIPTLSTTLNNTVLDKSTEK